MPVIANFPAPISQAAKIAILNIPAQVGSLTYNGKSQSPQWENFDAAQLSISGSTSETNAGTYTVTFTPTGKYCWPDGSTSAKAVTWSIAKASGKITLSASSLTLNPNSETASFTITQTGDGVLTVSASSDISAVLNGKTVTVTSLTHATKTLYVTVQAAASTNYTAASASCRVVESFSLNDYSWQQIREISDSGKAAEYWSLGDAKEIILNGKIGTQSYSKYSIWAFIIGFDHNSTLEGSHRIHFMIGSKSQKQAGSPYDLLEVRCLTDSYYETATSLIGSFTMNPQTCTSVGGWKDSHMRKTVLGSDSTPTSPAANTLLAALPEDLRAVMKSCLKYTDNVGDSSGNAPNVTATTDYLWLLSPYERWGDSLKDINFYTGIRPHPTEYDYQKEYAIFDIDNGISVNIKYCSTDNSVQRTASYLTRSPFYGPDFVPRLNTHFIAYLGRDITFEGNSPTAKGVNGARYDRSLGILPCFCV